MSKARRLGEGDDARDRFRPGPSFTLLMAADVLRGEAHAASYEERAHTLRRIKLVRREREQIATERLRIDGHSTCCLHCVCVKPEVAATTRALFAHKLAHFRDRLNSSDLIISEHQRDEDRKST